MDGGLSAPVHWFVFKGNFKGGIKAMGNDKSKEKLQKLIHGEITKLFESVLDYVQVACPTQDTYKVLRSKILRVGNNCIRNINRRVDTSYDVAFTALGEDVVEVSQS